MKLPSLVFAALLVPAIAACGDDADRPPSLEQLAVREITFRQACAAQEIEATAEEDLAMIDASLLNVNPDDPISTLSRRATEAAFDFSRAFHRHAQLRAGSYAALDSAVSHATTTADSARFVQRAGSFSIRPPEEGTVEANVIASYQQRFIGILENPDHRCNWDTPF